MWQTKVQSTNKCHTQWTIFSYRLETGHFDGSTADYLFLFLFNLFHSIIWVLFMPLGIISPQFQKAPFHLMDLMVTAVLYIWCMLHKETVVRFWFGIELKAMYLPWIRFLLDFVIFCKFGCRWNCSYMHVPCILSWWIWRTGRHFDRPRLLLPGVPVSAGIRRSEPDQHPKPPLQTHPQQARGHGGLWSGSGERRRSVKMFWLLIL